jgi:hypothetical protein
MWGARSTSTLGGTRLPDVPQGGHQSNPTCGADSAAGDSVLAGRRTHSRAAALSGIEGGHRVAHTEMTATWRAPG